MKKLLSLALSLLLACSLCTALAADYSDVFTSFDLRDSWTAATEITFTDTAVTINGSGAAADGTVVTITAPGVYKLQGSCADGQVLVEIDKAEKAQLVLAGLTLTCQSSAPLYVLSADKVSLTLAPDTVNTFTDGKAYTDKGCTKQFTNDELKNAFIKRAVICIGTNYFIPVSYAYASKVGSVNYVTTTGSSTDIKTVLTNLAAVADA